MYKHNNIYQKKIPELLIPQFIINRNINSEIRYSSWEILFDTNEESSIITQFCNVILKCPIDNRKELVNNILLLGGLSNITGLKERLYYELKNNNEMDRIKQLKDYIRYKDPLFPSEIVYWVSTSLLTSIITFNHQ